MLIGREVGHQDVEDTHPALPVVGLVDDQLLLALGQDSDHKCGRLGHRGPGEVQTPQVVEVRVEVEVQPGDGGFPGERTGRGAGPG